MSRRAAEVEKGITEEVRNFLLESETSREELDLAALNMQLGRDHGVPTCNKLRRSFGQPPLRSFNQVTRNPSLVSKLTVAYNVKVENMYPRICGISEDHRRGSSLGPLFDRIVRREIACIRR